MARIKADEVQIRHKELGAESVVKRVSLPTWEKAGWTVVEPKKTTKPASAGNGS